MRVPTPQDFKAIYVVHQRMVTVYMAAARRTLGGERARWLFHAKFHLECMKLTRRYMR